MRVGFDFDNTIVCYDRLFHRVAVERGWIPQDLEASKGRVRDYLRQMGREESWIELQGWVYGVKMADADMFPGVLECLKTLKERGIPVYIVSHRTRHPFRGPPADLHQAAREWLERCGFLDAGRTGIGPERIYLKLTKEEKLQCIRRLKLTHFVDDLPEFLQDSGFPPGVQRILFDPSGQQGPPPGLIRAGSWRELKELLAGEPEPADPSALLQSAGELARQAGLKGPFRLRRLPGGTNNRLFLLEGKGSRAVLKAYFSHPEEGRDRMGAEFSFCRFAWDLGIRTIPRPLACDPKGSLALYGFVEGRPLKASEVNGRRVRQALEFYRRINRDRTQPEAKLLPVASDGCFSLRDHFWCVERRLKGLQRLPLGSETDREAQDFVRGELRQAWERIRERAARQASEAGLKEDRVLEEEERRLSPSDFGFHNLLVDRRGRPFFLDFEYAGWDDPAKTACDFFSLRSVPVPLEYFEPFLSGVAEGLPDPEACVLRARMLLPVHRIKWSCILLNDFLEVEGQRRHFAQGSSRAGLRKARQLRKARRALKELQAARTLNPGLLE